MKEAIIVALMALFVITAARVVINVEGHDHRPVGAEQCTWGPGYWCRNITNAAACNATNHCIMKVWKTMQVAEDYDSVCHICKDMVTQARDQLESNETQENLRAVFEGSCKLMVMNLIVKECDRLVDQFIPELVEILASQMEPSVVCSVAGFCNSARIDQLLIEHEAMLKKINAKVVSINSDELTPNECSRCYTIATHMENKLSTTPCDLIATEFLSLCGQLSSLSDACSSILLVNFKTIFHHLKDGFKANNICHLSGQCANMFHKHEDDTDKSPTVEIRPLSSVGMVDVGEDLPCKLCEQLVGHLRDLLVANTTEIEFQRVLIGLCKQTKSFADECRSIVDQYYPHIYEYLINGLNTNAICQIGQLCPHPGTTVSSGVIMPLIPPKHAEIAVHILNVPKQKNVEVGSVDQWKSSHITEVERIQLPVDRFQSPFGILDMPNMNIEGQKSCAFCEYVLNYLQKVITNPMTEDHLKEALDKVCKDLPDSVEGTCDEFVSTYGDAVVALLAQEIDPSVVCPLMHVCPSQRAMTAWATISEGQILKPEVHDKPSCPLCLLAITQLYSVIKDNKTEENIEKQLDKLCTHLPKNLNNQCVDLVKGYSKELIEMLIADLTPQEVCIYIKLCDTKKNFEPTYYFPMNKNGEIMTNEIPNFPLHKEKKRNEDEKCILCEFLMHYVEKAMKNKANQDRIEKVVRGACNYLPHSISMECDRFVDQYAEMVIALLSQEVSAKEVCTLIGLCQHDFQKVVESIAECALCQGIISAVDTLLLNPTVDQAMEGVVTKTCIVLPASKQRKCTMLVEVYGQSIFNLLKAGVETNKICEKLSLCSNSDFFAMSDEHFRDRRADDLGKRRCTWGESYWCTDMTTAAECDAVEYCKVNVWKGHVPATSRRPEFTEEKSSSEK